MNERDPNETPARERDERASSDSGDRPVAPTSESRTDDARAEDGPVEPRRADLPTRLVQIFLGTVLLFLLNIPYIGAVTGFARPRRGGHRLYVSNHVSLLDTLLLGSALWTRNQRPMLVLGDAAVWSRDWLSRFLSARVGFLVERGRLSKRRVAELQAFGRSVEDFELIVFPEGTRGDGRRVKRIQPGIYHIAQAARAPIVPVFLEDMHKISTKTGRFHPLRGLRQLKIHFGEEIPPAAYQDLPREDFTDLIRDRIQSLRPES